MEKNPSRKPSPSSKEIISTLKYLFFLKIPLKSYSFDSLDYGFYLLIKFIKEGNFPVVKYLISLNISLKENTEKFYWTLEFPLEDKQVRRELKAYGYKPIMKYKEFPFCSYSWYVEGKDPCDVKLFRDLNIETEPNIYNVSALDVAYIYNQQEIEKKLKIKNK